MNDDRTTSKKLCSWKIKSCVSQTGIKNDIEFKKELHHCYDYLDKVQSTTHQDDLYLYVQKLKEECQILHHAYTYRFYIILFFNSNKDGEMFHGNMIIFDNNLFESYDKFL